MSTESVKAQTAWRPAEERDFGFILDTWLKSFQKSRAVKFVRPNIYYKQHKLVIDSLFTSCNTLIVKGPGDESQIAGYVVHKLTPGEGLIIHYVYVKQPLRRFGIASMVLDELVKMDKRLSHSHFTEDGNHLIKKYKSIYNPYLAGILQ